MGFFSCYGCFLFVVCHIFLVLFVARPFSRPISSPRDSCLVQVVLVDSSVGWYFSFLLLDYCRCHVVLMLHAVCFSRVCRDTVFVQLFCSQQPAPPPPPLPCVSCFPACGSPPTQPCKSWRVLSSSNVHLVAPNSSPSSFSNIDIARYH